MQEDSRSLPDESVEFAKKLTRLCCVAKIAQEEERRNSEREEFVTMGIIDCPRCRGDVENNLNQGNPHIQDLCPADREKIAQLVKKLAECTQAKHKAEVDLAEIRTENESLINRHKEYCNEHENEKSSLRQELAIVTSRENDLKLERTRSLNAIGDQMDVQEKEYVKLTETVRDLLREKIQLQNALIERESRVKIAEAKLERSKETLEMEKLLFIKKHARDSIVRNFRDRATQTCNTTIEDKKKTLIHQRPKISTKIKSKEDLEDPSGDGNLLRSLFFKPSTSYEDEYFSSLDILNHPDLQIPDNENLHPVPQF